MTENKRLKIAFLWHMHQPYYLDPAQSKFVMPWVRLHALKDYLDMPLTAVNNNIKATFNLVPSLLDQIELYNHGYTDRHLDLSRIQAKELTSPQKEEILKSFFDCNIATMVEPYPRYRQLWKKKDNSGSDLKLAVNTFSTSEWRDIQVWSNLVWIDPMFRSESVPRLLLAKGRDFSEEDKINLLDFQLELIGRIVPTYQKLYKEGRIDISFTPYYHPILPLLIDSQSAREAVSDIKLPKNQFRFEEDAVWQINKSVEKYEQLFGVKPSGMWPSEGSVSEETIKLIFESGIKWIASDEEILYQSLIKSGMSKQNSSPHFPYTCNLTPGLTLFFRDHGLSDKIGFVYSGWDTKRAVNDFMQSLKSLKMVLDDDLDNSLVPIILDGENAWEYYPDDATDFLNELYRTLAEDKNIEITTFTDMAQRGNSKKLPRLFAGSWINYNFKVWIGHNEDNTAWDLLYQARKDLTDFEKNNTGFDKTQLSNAWKQIYIAEGSDWCWWYGDDHIGTHNKDFDQLYRLHIASMYRIIGREVPGAVHKPIHKHQAESFISYPESFITPRIDGLITHYYEWSGAGMYDCDKSGGAMHRVDTVAKTIYFAYDADNFYIRLDFKKELFIVGKVNFEIVVDFGKNGQKKFKLDKGDLSNNNVRSSFNTIFEASIPRQEICPTGSGPIEFLVILFADENLVEKWPIEEPIRLDFPEKDKEIFWQV
ncbi:MAG: glycoside hydrolase family 57 protein [Candidatus Zixiibacteriota bacterium]